MAEKGAYIRDLQLLEQLNNEMEHTGKAMLDIHENISGYINRVKDALDRQLDFLREKLEEAQQRLSQAEQAASSCHSSQIFVPELGGYVPTCISEEMAVVAAQEEVAEWQHKYAEGQHIVGECQSEISEFESSSGGRGLIENMANNQTPQAIEQLRNNGIEKLQAILDAKVEGMRVVAEEVTNEISAETRTSLANDPRFEIFRNNIRGSKNNRPI